MEKVGADEVSQSDRRGFKRRALAGSRSEMCTLPFWAFPRLKPLELL